MQQYVHPEYVCHKLRLTGQSWDSALLLQKGIIVRQEKRSHLHLHGGGELSNAASEPLCGCWARPASADRLVPARSSPWLLTLPQPRNRWREESKGGKRGK